MANKLIRDTIHVYIEIPEIVINELVDTPVFQKLRQIEQTNMQHFIQAPIMINQNSRFTIYK